jgi:stage II sporulation protein R
MKTKRVLAFCSIIFIAVMVIGLLPVHGEWRIYDEVIRLHVLANSDSEEDQALKLKVRDGVIREVEGLIGGISDRDEAFNVLSEEESLVRIKDAAQRIIDAEGYGYEVSVALGEESYPRKNYEALCFPSGSYTSLRVQIGEAEGKNWWCVLFPQLCLGVATERNEEAFVEVGFTPEQYRIVTDTDEPEYEVRFKILEIIEGLMQ